jgi:hypothetical protein
MIAEGNLPAANSEVIRQSTRFPIRAHVRAARFRDRGTQDIHPHSRHWMNAKP